MREHLAEVRLIYIMRQPIERIVSQYIHEWSQREVKGSLVTALRRTDRYEKYSCYAEQLQPFLDTYGADAILPIAFERMLEFPDEELARVCRFIGDPTPDPPKWDSEISPQNVSSDRLRKDAFRDNLLARPTVQAIKNHLPQAFRDKVKLLWQMRKRPELPSQIRIQLEARIDKDLQLLSTWLGIDLTCRNWNDATRSEPLRWRNPPS